MLDGMNAVERHTIRDMLENYFFFTVIVSLCFCFLVSADLGRPFESKNENLELGEQPNLQNEQTLNAQLQTENGDYYTCVDVYKQPAFQNPLLKNHVLQWSPGAFPRKPLRRELLDEEIPRNFTPNQMLCPQHYVPILNRRWNNNTNDVRYTNALLVMLYFPNENFLGAEARMTVDNPACENGQSSGVGIGIGSDNSNHKSFIKAGWMVDPDNYGDSQTRLSTYWTGDGFQNTGCYDLQCPGFVQINTNLILGAPVVPVSIFGGKQYEVFVSIFQDVVNKHWWLVLSNGEESLYIGYWPKELFPGFRDGGSVLILGGRASARPGQKFPPMGYGLLPDGNYKHSGIFREILIVNSSNYLVPPRSVQVHVNKPNCYGLTYMEHGEQVLGHSFFIGGPGC